MKEQQIKNDINTELKSINSMVETEVSKTGTSAHLNGLLSFLKWINVKFRYMTTVNNTRSVMQGEIYY